MRDGIQECDLLLITPFPNPPLRRFFSMTLKQYWPSIKWDVGNTTNRKIMSDLSCEVYDIKKTGIVLAGENVKLQIPCITPSDLYPNEGFRFLLNRSIRLALETFITFQTIDRYECDPKWTQPIARQVYHSCINALAIFEKRYTPSLKEKIEICKECYPDLASTPLYNLQRNLEKDKQINPLDLVRSSRDSLFYSIKIGMEKVRLYDLSSLVHRIACETHYPIFYRLITILRSGEPLALLRNPILDVFTNCLNFLIDIDMKEFKKVEWQRFKARNLSVYLTSPQPIRSRRCKVKRQGGFLF